jgi:Uma2 family endonuclease
MPTTIHATTCPHSKPSACNLANSSFTHSRIAYPPSHQAIALKIAAALLRHVEENCSGRVFHAPCNVLLSRNTLVQPDILYVKNNRRGIIGRSHLYGAPDLVVEVLSQTSKTTEYYSKKGLYSRFGVQEFWTADSARHTVETWIWSEVGFVSTGSYGKSDKLASFVLPDLDLPIASIF